MSEVAECLEIINSFSFECPKCGDILTTEKLLIAASENGIIQLTGERDGYFGWTCPTCNELSTNFIKLEIELFNQVIKALRSLLVTVKLGKLCYHSFPYRYDLKESDFFLRAGRVLLAEYEVMHESRLEYEKPKFEPTLKYCSYDFASDALGPIIYVWWYDGSKIENLMQRENDTGLKLFPRYIIHHSMYSIINKFCWDHRVYLEELKSLNKDMSAFFRTPSNRTPKAVGFLTLIDTVNEHRLSSYPEPLIPIILPRIRRRDDCGRVIPYVQQKEMLQNVLSDGNLWDIINVESVRRVLNDLAENYITDYLGLLEKNDCNLSSIRFLNAKYLGTLYKAFNSQKNQDEISEKANADLRIRIKEAEKAFPKVKISSKSNAIGEIKIQISKLAPSKLADTFLILGERGTGKEIFAAAIHEASNQKGRLIKVDCGAITETLFESEIFGHIKSSFTGADRDRKGALEEAKGGSVFFDEIGNLPLTLQPKLLRVLQDRKYVPVGTSIERPIDAKFIFATNKDLDDMVRKELLCLIYMTGLTYSNSLSLRCVIGERTFHY